MGLEKSDRHNFPTNLQVIKLEIQNDPSISNPSPIGINLGQWNSWEAQQYGKNVLMNPGFEGNIDRTLVFVSQSNKESFSDEAGWGDPNDSWNEANFEILTGRFTGKKGKIKKSLRSGENGFPQYFPYNKIPLLSLKEIILLSKERPPNLSGHWIPNDASTIKLDPYDFRPKSSGKWSMRLVSDHKKNAQLSYYFDLIPERAGKLLPVLGKWQFSLWAKAEKQGSELDVRFERLNGTAPFFHKKISLNEDWAEYFIDFESNDRGPPGILRLRLETTTQNQRIWIDDVFLSPLQEGSTFFRDEIVHSLQELKPSFLREFPHLGDSFDNWIIGPYERKTWISRKAGGLRRNTFSYSLPEFLNLCSEVKANPWIILSPTFLEEEYEALGRYLSKKANVQRFEKVIIEFGYENWNWQYKPAGIPYPKKHGILAKRAFDVISHSAKNVNFQFFVNGQHSVPWISLQYLDHTPNADGLAIAPYFFYSLTKGTPDDKILEQLFMDDQGFIQEAGDETFFRDKNLAVYELNLHTTEGDAKAYERDRVVAGAVSGSALAKKILECLLNGADPIMVYALAQHDTVTRNVPDAALLWGIIRDFGPPVRMRPTGLAIKMLNSVIEGNGFTILPQKNSRAEEKKKLTMMAFKGKSSWTAAIVSSHSNPLVLELKFPEDEHPLPNKAFSLDVSEPFQTNEHQEKVKILENNLQQQDRNVTFVVPAWGLVVIKS